MRQVLVIEVLSQAPDSTGQPADTWSEAATVRGLVQPATGTEVQIANQLKAKISHGITIRHPGFTVNPALHRINMQGRIFNIVQARNLDERNREWRITALEDLSPSE